MAPACKDHKKKKKKSFGGEIKSRTAEFLFFFSDTGEQKSVLTTHSGQKLIRIQEEK